MQQCHTASEVAAALLELGVRRVAIDGTDGCGKSTLAEELGPLLGAQVIHLDYFVAKGLGAYIRNLDYSRLATHVASSELTIVEGICVLEALERVSLAADALVYVKHMSHGYWSDEEELHTDLPVEEHLAQVKANLQPWAEVPGDSGELGVGEEVIRYHVAYKPHEKADIAYLRTDA